MEKTDERRRKAIVSRFYQTDWSIQTRTLSTFSAALGSYLYGMHIKMIDNQYFATASTILLRNVSCHPDGIRPL
jgi:hypothetical protein